MYAELDILKIISTEKIAVGSDQRNLVCPECGCPSGHVKPGYTIIGDEWHGNGELAVVPIDSECGSQWAVCIGQHKGDSPIFFRVFQSCKIVVDSL